MAAKLLAWALFAFIIWLTLQLVLTIVFNYSYGRTRPQTCSAEAI